jgi:SAM-dependent methyltransferase
MNVVSQREWYLDWFNSPFYHKLYFEKNEEQVSQFINILVRYLRPEHGALILDTACGRGRHSKMLSALGLDVTGIDISGKDIEMAKIAESSKLRFFIHDIRRPFWINYFHYAFNLFSRFGYFKTRREHDDTIRTICSSVRPGGHLIIDYLNVRYEEDHQVHNETRVIGSTVYDFYRWDDDTHFYSKITITDPVLLQPFAVTEKIAKLTLGDFTNMLKFQSVQVQEVFGNYDLSPYDLIKTPRLIIIARKKANGPSDNEKRLYSDGRSTDALT